MMQIVDRRKLDENLDVRSTPVLDEGRLAASVERLGVDPAVVEAGDNLVRFDAKEQPAYPGKAKVARTWVDVDFMIALMNINGMQVVSGRAVGLRSDKRVFVADYIFSPRWERGLDWTAISESRLNTYLDCGCQDGRACEVHEKETQEWLMEGVERLQALGAQPLSKALEALVKAQQQQPRILAPGR